MTKNPRTRYRLLLSIATLTVLAGVHFASAQTPLKLISLDQAIQLALTQASNFRQSQLNEEVATQEVYQAKKAFMPTISSNPTLIYTSPSLGNPLPGTPRLPSHIAANAIREYLVLMTAAGEIDISGRLRANRRRAQFLLQAAYAGTETARRALINTTAEAYFTSALATAQRNSADANLRSASEFESLTKQLVDGGEMAPVDLMRAQVQTATRRDELEQAKANERVAADSLRLYLGIDIAQEITVSDLCMLIPEASELLSFSIDGIADRPELQQIQAETRAANEEAKIAKAERRSQVTYSVGGGFDSDSLSPRRVHEFTGVTTSVGVTIPIFDWGMSKSRQKQAELRAQSSEASRQFALRQFSTQFNSNLTQARSAASRIRELADNLAKAERILEVAIGRYRAGETQILEVTDSQTRIITQRNGLLQAIFEYRIAVARLRQATGK